MALDQQKSNNEDPIESTWWAFYSFHEYKMALEGTNRKNKRVEKLEALEEHLKDTKSKVTDPIQYLHILYFWGHKTPRLTVENLWEKTKDIWLNFTTSDWLHKMLQSFEWNLFPNTEKTEKWWQNSANNSHNRWISDSNVTVFRNTLLKVLDIPEVSLATISFNETDYNSIRFPIDKALYLIWLNKDNFKAVIATSSFWKTALTSCINTLCDEAVKRIQNELWLQIVPPALQKWSIWNLMRKLNS